MTKTSQHHEPSTNARTRRFSSDLETLKGSFADLRDDVSRLLDNTLGTGKSGAGVLKDRAATAVGDLKDRGAESVDKLGQKIGERPLLSAAIALGIGFILAKLLTTKR
jgi:ElaB/YqjD/DUF883 family membrane-anchored ribosome-binding protein